MQRNPSTSEHQRRTLIIRTAVLTSWLLLCIPKNLPAEVWALPVVPKPRVVQHLNGVYHFVPSHTTIRLALRDTSGVMPAVEEILTISRTLFGKTPAQGP